MSTRQAGNPPGKRHTKHKARQKTDRQLGASSAGRLCASRKRHHCSGAMPRPAIP